MTGKTVEVARVILKEIPVAQLSQVIGRHGANAMGDGCGGGCNGGHTGLTDHEIKSALKDADGLRSALKHAIGTVSF
jgi:hypothetical protein